MKTTIYDALLLFALMFLLLSLMAVACVLSGTAALLVALAYFCVTHGTQSLPQLLQLSNLV